MGFRQMASWVLVATMLAVLPAAADASCATPANAIEAENCLPGTPDTVWDIPTSDAGDATIQGYATQISVTPGSTVSFKVKTTANAYTMDVYRMGYYQGNGARKVTSLTPSVPLPQAQPACLTDAATNLIDCGNWAVSASWAVPANAVSGIYFVVLKRTDTGGKSHMVFVVRDDTSHAAILFQASDTSWQAYNDYGGENFYGCGGFNQACRAFKVSYNRPFNTRSFEPQTWVFSGEYPMIRWLEANSYDVSYSTATDTDRNGALLLNHKLYLSNGHDEYWSGAERANVEAARAAGVNLAFFSSNAIYWKTRWESSIDGSGTPYRTLVSYKETWSNAKIDPNAAWTGTWRDPRFSPPSDGGRPENALMGMLSRYVTSEIGAISVAQADGQLRFWRNTPVASLPTGGTTALAPGSLGEEVDIDEDNGFRPAGLMHLSTTPITGSDCLVDYGNITSTCSSTHAVTLYRHSSGALVLSTGTYWWSWGLDTNHDQPATGGSTDSSMQQATVNFLADVRIQPATLQAGLVLATASTDTIAPTSHISSPSAGASFPAGATVTITGTATDTGGVVAGVEVSVDGGVTWHPASGRSSWSYAWAAAGLANASIMSRAVDDSGNVETPGAGVNVTVSGGGYNIWSPTANPSEPQALASGGPDNPIEVGVKFRADVPGTISGIRFYKLAANAGTHIGSLWSASGQLLASATFTNEASSGWQEVHFATAVAIAPNTVYVASYHSTGGNYADTINYFVGNGTDTPPLHALSNTVGGGNGVFAYGATSIFPTTSFSASNYWVDVSFQPSATLASLAVTPSNPIVGIGSTVQMTATGTYSDGSTQDFSNLVSWSSSNTAAATVSSGGVVTGVANGTATISASVSGLTSSVVATVKVIPVSVTTTTLPAANQNAGYSATLAGTGGTPPYTWSAVNLPAGLTLNAATGVISGMPTGPGPFNVTVQITDSSQPAQTAPGSVALAVAPAALAAWPVTAAPTVADAGPDSAVELGVKFTVDVSGSITGVRFYKSAANTGTHVANLWSAAGTLLASASFANESASGWQQANFAAPVAVTAATVYVASYHSTSGHFALDASYFATQGVDNAPLHLLANGVSGADGVFAYGSASVFPSSTYNSSNYWVDVAFQRPNPTSVSVAPTNGVVQPGTTQQYSATGTYPDGSSGDVTTQVTWTSANTAVATVSATGVVRGISTGTSTITASIGGLATAVPVTVKVIPLAVATTALPAANQNAGYTALVSGIGGTAPYSWAAVGALPAGLTLNATTGAISGTPTAAGTFSIALQVSDSASPIQTAAGSVTLTVAAGALSGWPLAATPVLADAGPDAAAELGVKFRTDSDGTVTGVRFYKSAANVGTHIANLWTSTGTLLATATFVNDSASGWQQANFATPVAVTANTVYVASYHATSGHYALDQNYFAGAGIDAPPVHLLADGVSGPDGAYSYGATSAFPATGFKASNYWVDVAFAPGAPTVATVTLPTATQAAGYSASLAATGGLAPYSWTATSALPAGLSMTAAGNLSGTPTTAGSSSFTVQVADAQNPSKTGSASVSLVVAAAGSSAWATAATPTVSDAGPDSPVELGVKFRSDVSGNITGVRFYKSVANTGTHVANLWTTSGTLLATATFGNESASGWQQANFASPVAITANTDYVASYHTNVGHFAADGGFFSGKGVDNAPLHLLADGIDGGDGVFSYGVTSTLPASTFNATNYWVDVAFAANAPPPPPPPDTIAPSVAISAPTAAATYTATAATLTVAGTAADNVGVTQVSWSNSLGGSGTAAGTTSWSAAGIVLKAGSNLITVTASDAAGNHSAATLSVSYTPPDTTAPTVAITAPTSAATFSTSTAPLTLGGTAADNVGVVAVNWTNSLGGAGTATGTSAWSVPTIALKSGLNTITVTASDAAGNVATATLGVTYTAPPDTTPPTIAITSPTTAATFTTTAGSLTVGGTASDNVGVASVTWVNSRGGSGTASGTTSWSAAGVALQSGSNVITVTAKDAAGNSKTATLTVTFNPPAGYGLVAAYSFNEGTGVTVNDASGNGNTGSITGATWTMNGRFGKALVFNGTNSRVFVNASSSLNFTAGMSLEAWVFPTAAQTGNRTIIYREQDVAYLRASQAARARVPAGGGTIGGTVLQTTGSTALALNTWQFLTVTYDGTILRLYVNGTQVASGTATGALATSLNPLWIGGNNPFGEYFQGRIDEVRVYNRALSAAEIAVDQTTAITP